jgi:hypothetical protein
MKGGALRTNALKPACGKADALPFLCFAAADGDHLFVIAA